jgi:hypothetical protein
MGATRRSLLVVAVLLGRGQVNCGHGLLLLAIGAAYVLAHVRVR